MLCSSYVCLLVLHFSSSFNKHRLVVKAAVDVEIFETSGACMTWQRLSLMYVKVVSEFSQQLASSFFIRENGIQQSKEGKMKN